MQANSEEHRRFGHANSDRWDGYVQVRTGGVPRSSRFHAYGKSGEISGGDEASNDGAGTRGIHGFGKSGDGERRNINLQDGVRSTKEGMGFRRASKRVYDGSRCVGAVSWRRTICGGYVYYIGLPIHINI